MWLIRNTLKIQAEIRKAHEKDTHWDSEPSLPENDFIVKADKERDQILWDLMLVTGESGFCDNKHPVSYQSLDQRNMCDAYPERQSELYDHMDTNHMEVAEMLDEY